MSTANGVPTEDDLVRVMQRGMPGSAMPSFGWVPEEDLRILASHVRELAVEGFARGLRRQGLPESEARRAAVERLVPGQVLEVGQADHVTTESLHRGEQLYLAHCAKCHREDARGERPDTPYGEAGLFQWPRDFTRGVLKGGASHRDLAWRIRAGMPGSTMPPTPIEDPAEMAKLVAYVQSLLAPGAANRLVQNRRSIPVRRVPTLPADTSDHAWGDVEETTVVLAPLAWTEHAVLAATISAVHDGQRIATRIRWEDRTRDQRPLRGSALSDAVALQLSTESAPPLFGMGSRNHVVDIWHWKPWGAGDASALMEMVEGRQRPDAAGGRGRSDAPVHSKIPASGGRAVRAEGLRSARHFADKAVSIRTYAAWNDGTWTVVFTRDLTSDGPLRILPSSRVQVACAVWDGSARNDDAQKSISIWHELVLDP